MSQTEKYTVRSHEFFHEDGTVSITDYEIYCGEELASRYLLFKDPEVAADLAAAMNLGAKSRA